MGNRQPKHDRRSGAVNDRAAKASRISDTWGLEAAPSSRIVNLSPLLFSAANFAPHKTERGSSGEVIPQVDARARPREAHWVSFHPKKDGDSGVGQPCHRGD